MNLPRLLKLWSPAVIWAMVIFTLSSFSSLPSAQKIWWDYIFKKSAHITVYAILYALIFRALDSRKPQAYLIAFIITVCYAVSDEYHQSFTPGRHPKITDVGFDSLGAFSAYLRIKNLI